jgi:hypothetical protein
MPPSETFVTYKYRIELVLLQLRGLGFLIMSIYILAIYFLVI